MRTVAILMVAVGMVMMAPIAGTASAMQDGGAKYTWSLTKDYMPSEWTSEADYKQQAKGKFLFGAKNMLLSCTELYNEPRDAAKADTKMSVGIGHGIRNMVGDTLGGALHLVTFPITALDVPLPEGGTDLL